MLPLRCQSCPHLFLLLRKLRSRVRCLLHHLGGRLHQQQLPEEPHVHRQPELPKHLLIVFSHMQIHSFKGSCTQSTCKYTLSKVVVHKVVKEWRSRVIVRINTEISSKGTSDICMIRLDFVDGTISEPAGIRSPVFVLSLFYRIRQQ